MRDLAVIVTKELVQISNRKRFHLEKALFAFAAAAAFAWLASRQTGLTELGISQARAFGRRIFFPVVIGACGALSLVSLAAASGIILSERMGKRLDLLRITPMALSTIVLGKGLAVMSRAMLVALLILPFTAAMQFFRGVSAGDISKAFSLIVAYVFFCVMLGLMVSAGSVSRLDRAVRLFESVCVVVFLSLWVPVEIYNRTGAPQSFLALSPFFAWGLLAGGRLSWPQVVVNVALYGGMGFLFLKGACSGMRRSVAERELREAPHVTRLWQEFKRLRRGVRTARRREGWLQRLLQRGKALPPPPSPPAWHPLERPAEPAQAAQGDRQDWWRRLERWNIRPPEWMGGLVSGELRRTSALLVLIPPATLFPSLVFFAAGVAGEGMLADRLVESLHVGAELFGAAVAVAVGLQGLSMLSGEKARHTAASLAVTPVAGLEMIGWKGAAILVAQGLSIAACVLWVLLAGVARRALPWEMFADVLAFLATICFVFAVGASFSQVASTPMRATGQALVSLFVLAPMGVWLLSAGQEGIRGVWHVMRLVPPWAITWLVLLLALVVLVVKNYLPRVAAPAHTVAAALAAVAVIFGLGLYAETELWGQAYYARMFTFVFASWRTTWTATLAAGLAKLLLAGVLLAPMPLNFTALLTQETAREG